MIVAEFAATGSLSTAWFHALVAGNTWQPAIFGGVGVAPVAATQSTAAAAASAPARTFHPALAGVSLPVAEQTYGRAHGFLTVAEVDVPTPPRMP